MKYTYAYVCFDCNHRLARHTAKVGEALYHCAFCTCAVPQDAPARELSKYEYEEWIVAHPEPVTVERE